VWLVWSLALVGWYRYALVAPRAEPLVAAPRLPAFRHLETNPSSFDHAVQSDDPSADPNAEPGWTPPPIDWSTAEMAPAMHAPRRTVEAIAAPAEAGAQVKAPTAYQFTTHRQDDVSAS
jgi:hypothetical protein